MEDYERLQDQLLTFRGQKRPGRDTGERAADADGEPVPLTRWPLRDVLALTPDEAEAWLDTACELEKRLSA